MARVTSYPEILSSNLDPTDLFYIVDHNPVDGKNVSRNIKYETLFRDLDNRIGVTFFKDASIKNGSVLQLVFQLKNGTEKTLTVDLSGLVDFYNGDNTTISVDDSTRTIHVIANYLSSNALNGISVDWQNAANKLSDFNGVVPSDAKFTDTVISNGFGISSYENVFGVNSDEVALKTDIKTYSQGKGIEIENGTISVRVGENLGFDSEGKLTATGGGSGGGVSYDYVKQHLSSDGYGLKTIFREWSYVE